MSKRCENLASTIICSRLELVSYAYLLVDSDGLQTYPIIKYIGPNAGENFIQNLIADLQHVHLKLKENIPIQWNDEKRKLHSASTHCKLCKIAYNRNDQKRFKCANHQHSTGVYLFDCCSACNLQLKALSQVRFFFHNLNFDICAMVLKEIVERP